MAKEIERKFLPADERWRGEAHDSKRMRQGYLATSERASVRVRTSGGEAWLNIKVGGLVAVRDEFEYAIPLEDADALLARSATGPLIDKTRHYVEVGGFEWEIDEFHGDNTGLIVAEIELDDLFQTFPSPAWLGSEVTEMHRYYNVNLAARPFKDWSDAERSP
jgi:adenylate cyclase